MTVFMEEHCQAYFAWKQAGIRDAWCWHVDAHLDVGRDGLEEGRLTALQACDSWEQAQQQGLCGNAYLPWGGLHCGNYLYPAIRQGIVSRLTWVVPDYLPQPFLLDWARRHLDGWFDLTVAEYSQLREENGVVQGTVLGIPFALGIASRLPAPDQPVLLDVDLDYFLTETGEPWSSPEQLPPVKSALTTVAYSVRGGYTPTSQRELAQAFGRPSPDGYQANALDQAAAMVRQKQHERALPVLAGLRGDYPIEASYLLGTCYHQLGCYPQALECWQDLATRPELSPDGKAYVGGLRAEALLALEQPAEALQQAQGAQQWVEPNFRLLWLAATALEQLGELREATRTLRRALVLAEPYVFGLQMRLGLSRLYRRQDKIGLAKLELERLEKADLSGEFRPLTLLR